MKNSGIAKDQEADYKRIYEEQRKLGRSEIFAHEYAMEKLEGHTDLCCYAYAEAYERSFNNGKSEDYAVNYADRYSEYIANHYSAIEDVAQDAGFQFYHDQIIAQTKALGLLQALKPEDTKQFLFWFEQEYMNTYYKESIRSTEAEEVLDKVVLEKVVKKLKMTGHE